MITLLAHHVEVHHLPSIFAIFGAGFWIGWRITANFLQRRRERASADRSAGRA